ncbi:hypothetical protein NLG07_00035 [Alteromonas sp. LMIT006]|uniref:hypothetical protein n=1 Tax=Alteromonadaceae TaxID=72275 RepID=UPI0020CA4FFE|nr:hypothetical protein [Alteromonas sp. LMIT006]UTP72668.1 hypothetical protein NLG07_00035 [Alteromonas sp. LMIT006]
MIKYIVLITFLAFSFGCKATTCLITEESIAENSSKYAELFKITLTKRGPLLNVELSAPTEIEGKVLQGVLLHKIEKGQTVFTIPLNTYVENSRVSSWYDADEQLVVGNFITFDYGENCGLSLKYVVK